jgi:hypothetical protein
LTERDYSLIFGMKSERENQIKNNVKRFQTKKKIKKTIRKTVELREKESSYERRISYDNNGCNVWTKKLFNLKKKTIFYFKKKKIKKHKENCLN